MWHTRATVNAVTPDGRQTSLTYELERSRLDQAEAFAAAFTDAQELLKHDSIDGCWVDAIVLAADPLDCSQVDVVDDEVG